MAAAVVRFHPAAAQEAESTYDWYAARNASAAHGFREELRQAIDAAPGRATAAALDGTCSRDIRSVWCISTSECGRRCAPSLIRRVRRTVAYEVGLGCRFRRRTVATEG